MHFVAQMLAVFHTLGVRVSYIDDRRNYIIPFLPRNRLIWRASRRIRWLRRWNDKLLNALIIKRIMRNSFDLVLINKGMTVFPTTLRAIRDRGIITANWFVDNPNVEEYKYWVDSNASLYDFFFTFYDGVSKGIFLPVGVDNSFFENLRVNPASRARYTHKLVFVGAYYPERESLLSAVQDLDLIIYGSKAWGASSLGKLYRGSLMPEQFKAVYECSDICININAHPPVAGVNLKTFEIPMCNGFQLSDYRSGLEKLFEIGKEIAVFHDEKELRIKVEYYLAHPKEREAIREAGRKRVLADHTMMQRIRTLLNTIFPNSYV